MNTVSSDPVVVGRTASLAMDTARSRQGFWALIATQFQGAFSDNILRNLLLSMIVGMNVAKSERETFVSVVMFLFSVPFLILSMPGGRLADRFSKRQMTIWTKVILEKLPQCDLPALWKPKANQFVHVDSIPALGTGKMDLRAIKALATSLTAEVEAEAQA